MGRIGNTLIVVTILVLVAVIIAQLQRPLPAPISIPVDPGPSLDRRADRAVVPRTPPPADRSVGSPAVAALESPAVAPVAPRVAAPSPVPAPAPSSAAPASARIRMSGPMHVEVGQEHALVVSIEGAHGVKSIGFRVKADGSVLELRNASEGDLMKKAGRKSHLTVDSGYGPDDGIWVRSAVDGTAPVSGSGAVASVHFVAMSPGPIEVNLADIVVTDFAGKPIPVDAPAQPLVLQAE